VASNTFPVPWVGPQGTGVEILIELFIRNYSINTGFILCPSSGTYTLGYCM